MKLVSHTSLLHSVASFAKTMPDHDYELERRLSSSSPIPGLLGNHGVWPSAASEASEASTSSSAATSTSTSSSAATSATSSAPSYVSTSVSGPTLASSSSSSSTHFQLKYTKDTSEAINNTLLQLTLTYITADYAAILRRVEDVENFMGISSACECRSHLYFLLLTNIFHNSSQSRSCRSRPATHLSSTVSSYLQTQTFSAPRIFQLHDRPCHSRVELSPRDHPTGLVCRQHGYYL